MGRWGARMAFVTSLLFHCDDIELAKRQGTAEKLLVLSIAITQRDMSGIKST